MVRRNALRREKRLVQMETTTPMYWTSTSDYYGYGYGNDCACKDGQPGPPGPRGVKGSHGIKGPKGMKGAVGPQGSRGPKGWRGPAGPRGPQGPEGPQGPNGTAGEADVGATGSSGSTGNNASFSQLISSHLTGLQGNVLKSVRTLQLAGKALFEHAIITLMSVTNNMLATLMNVTPLYSKATVKVKYL